MIRTFILASGVVIAAAAVAVPSHAEHPDVLAHTPARARDAAAPAASAPAAANPAAPAPAFTPPAPEAAAPAPAAPSPAAAVPAVTSPAPEALAPAASAPATPETEAMRSAISSLAPGDNDEERNERAALVSFYEARGHAPLWLTAAGGFTPQASLAAAEIKRAGDWGLDARDFALPAGLEQSGAAPSTPEAVAAAEIEISQAVLKYGRYARGGRIINPSEQLSSYLDRRPQFLKPAAILEGIAAAAEPDAYLRGLHPVHPQFEKLRQKYLTVRGRGKQPGAEAKRLLANMEQWRWMPIDMGSFYIWNNVPEFMQRVIKDGEVVRKERIVAGELGKQTPVFTRPLRKITLKPTWIVPDSIKVRELWPSLLKGGGLMREWALEVRTKDGQPVDWRSVNWAATDIREYDVIQPNGPKSVMGKVKFTFPSQHTVFMHDSLERDRYMFSRSQRTYSHGCMRLANPIGLVAVVLREDKGWDAAQINEMVARGPLNNEIAIERKIPVHTTYFTAIAGEDGKVQMFPDVYGHERRITLALEGKWGQIVKGRDHLAPVDLNLADAQQIRSAPDKAERNKSNPGADGFFNSIFGN